LKIRTFKGVSIPFELNHNHQIEFWIKNGNDYVNSLHFDCDEVLRSENIFEYPLLSCVTYFDDSNYPFILTDIDVENYKYKNFNESKQLHILFPNKYTHVSFDPKYYHGAINILDGNINKNRSLLAINIWDKKKNLKEYKSIEFENIYTKKESIIKIQNNIEFNNYILTENILDFDFYETLLYNTHLFNQVIPKIIIDYINEKLNNNQILFIINNPENKKINVIDYNTSLEFIEFSKQQINKLEYNQENEIKDNQENEIKDELENEIKYNQENEIKYNQENEIKDEIENKIEIKHNNFSIINNRFLQRFTFSNTYSNYICKWIISEAELYASHNNGWTTLRHNKYPTTDLPIDKIYSIYNFIMLSLNNIFDKITKAYCLPKTTNYNINDMFIVKYHQDFQNDLELHQDGSFLTFNILLSEINDFEGGGTFFYDGIVTHLNCGDMIVHSGKIKHAGLPITKGTRYLLVAFIDVDSFN